MLDAQLGKGSPGVFHLTNVAFHVLNTLLLYILLRWTTGFPWRSAAVSALFALHPLHVESVAWITERKDVLSTFFWLLTMLAFVWYAKAPAVRRYVLVVLTYALGLMAKPMLVSLPLALLLLDYWPLGRRELWPLIREKIPLFVMAAASCVVTYWAQQTGGAVVSYDAFPIGVRVANAFVAYASYVIKMVCPLNLSAIYPHPGYTLPVWQVVSSGLFFALMLGVAIKSARSRPYITVGWLWYVVTLVPVIGLVQVGQQAMADRYTYVPMIGLFIIVAWGVPELIAEIDMARGEWKMTPAWTVIGVVILAGLTASTYLQVGYWRDSISLYEHSLALDKDNYLAHFGYGFALAAEGKLAQAVKEYEAGLKMEPRSAQAQCGLGFTLAQMGRYPEAVEHIYEANRIQPDNPVMLDCLGSVLTKMGRADEAITHLKRAIELSPDDPAPHYDLGLAFLRKGLSKKAANEFEATIRLDPGYKQARELLAR